MFETEKSIPTELRNEARDLQHEIAMDVRGAAESNVDDEYANIGSREPKICVTTSRDPSSRLKQFAKYSNMIYIYIYRM